MNKKKALVIVGYWPYTKRPGWAITFPFLVNNAANILEPLKKNGYDAEVLLKPSEQLLRQKLADPDVKAITVFGDAPFRNSEWTFLLNEKEVLTADKLQTWAFEDRWDKRPAQNPFDKEATMRLIANYGMDYVVVNTCYASNDSKLSWVLGGEFHGGEGLHYPQTFPGFEQKNLPLRVSIEDFDADPMAAIRAAFCNELSRQASECRSLEEYVRYRGFAAMFLKYESKYRLCRLLEFLLNSGCSLQLVNESVPPATREQLEKLVRSMGPPDPKKFPARNWQTRHAGSGVGG